MVLKACSNIPFLPPILDSQISHIVDFVNFERLVNISPQKQHQITATIWQGS